MRGVWRDAGSVDPNTHNNKLATCHSWFAIPFSRNERMPINIQRYLHLDLSKHVMRNVSRFRLRAHTLKVEAATWLEDGSRVCDQCPGEDEHVQNEVHALLLCQDYRVWGAMYEHLRVVPPGKPFVCLRAHARKYSGAAKTHTAEQHGSPQRGSRVAVAATTRARL